MVLNECKRTDKVWHARALEHGQAVPRCCQKVKMCRNRVARSCLQAQGPRAKVLPCVVEERDFRGLCLGNVFGWKLGQEGSLSSDTKYDVPFEGSKLRLKL